MFEIPRYVYPVSLIPGGCPQLLDFEAGMGVLEKIRYGFAEIHETDADGSQYVILRALRRNEAGDYADEIDPERIINNFDYEFTGQKAILPWLNAWLPVPFLRVREQTWADSGECRFDYGPANWARARLTQTQGNTLRLTLAFDMAVEDKQASIYPALTKEDVDANAHFRLAWRFRDNSWFIDLAWVEEWLREIWISWRRKNKMRSDDEGRFRHLAAYLTFLTAINNITCGCETYVVRPDGGCMEVDLILDIGNSRTTGILVETHPQSVTSLNNSYLLQLRDMDEPDKIYTEPFDTRIEFSEVHFGNDALSLRSGRKTPAFVWPSPVRIGPEAARLATLSRCEKGSTGMSSPKRYLWDERDWLRTWRFNTKSEKAPYVTRGPLAQRINSSGTPLCCMNDRQFCKNRILRNQERESAFESLFTRSSLMMFLLVEIIQQALLTINAPGQRSRRDLRDLPRRLRQIIFTMPAGMPMAEQKIYKRWGLWAVAVLWEALGWGKFYTGNDRRHSEETMNDYRRSPIVRCDWDEATCTQLVFAYNEVVHKFQGDALLFCELLGKERSFGEKRAPSVRIAAIDIGGGTTDLSITTFELSSPRSSAPRLTAHPEFHDGFNLAGDDILRAVIADHILPALGEAMHKNGIPDVNAALAALFGRTSMDTSQASLSQRIQFIRQVAVPAGLYILSLYEKSDLSSAAASFSLKLGDCFAPADPNPAGMSADLFPLPDEHALDYIKDYIFEKTGVNTDILAIELAFDPAAIDHTVSTALRWCRHLI